MYSFGVTSYSVQFTVTANNEARVAGCPFHGGKSRGHPIHRIIMAWVLPHTLKTILVDSGHSGCEMQEISKSKSVLPFNTRRRLVGIIIVGGDILSRCL